MSPQRTTILRIAAALLAVLLLGTLVILVHPILVTGRYYDLMIRDVQHGPGGMLSITYDETISYGTSVSWTHPAARGTQFSIFDWGGGSRQFPHWPRTERDQTWAIYLNSEEERARGVGDSPEIRQRWLLQKGTYRIRPGERLVLTRWQAPDGTVLESAIEVRPK
jgi:hypothetical protein